MKWSFLFLNDKITGQWFQVHLICFYMFSYMTAQAFESTQHYSLDQFRNTWDKSPLFPIYTCLRCYRIESYWTVLPVVSCTPMSVVLKYACGTPRTFRVISASNGDRLHVSEICKCRNLRHQAILIIASGLGSQPQSDLSGLGQYVRGRRLQYLRFKTELILSLILGLFQILISIDLKQSS